MRSKAHISTHPIHPMLVGFPIAFFIGTFIFDLLAMITGNDSFLLTARYLTIAGIVTALLAAAFGFIDFLFTVPPNSSAKKRAAKHGLLNVLIVGIFAVTLYLRLETEASLIVILVLELIALVLLTITGWMGGTLVYRNHIGVYNRYADKGNWNEAYVGKKEGKIEVASADELKTDQMKLVHFNGKRVIVARSESGFVAFDDHCTHRGGSLAGGVMICGTVQCPWHGSQFDVTSGKVKAGPANEPITTYAVNEENGKVFLSF